MVADARIASGRWTLDKYFDLHEGDKRSATDQRQSEEGEELNMQQLTR